jgi:hypothetical protein
VFELPFTVAAYCADALSVTLVGPLRLSVTVGPPPPPAGGCDAAARATASPWDTDGSATLVAAIVTFTGWGAVAGAL